MTIMTLMMVLAVVVPAATRPTQCPNSKGQPETCGPLQFCSAHILKKGCRNCTDIAEKWCDQKPDVFNEFRQKYPQCEILCERKKLDKTQEELNATGVALRKTEEKVVQLGKKLDKTEEEQKATRVALRKTEEKVVQLREKVKEIEAEKASVSAEKQTLLSVVLGLSCFQALTLCLVVVLFIRACRRLPAGNSVLSRKVTEGTASVMKGRKGWWRRLCQCFMINRKKRRFHPPVSDLENPEQGAFLPLSDVNPAAVYSPAPTEDSGHSSSVQTSHSSVLNDAVAPSGGTVHHPDDTKDFMLNSDLTDNGNGGGGGGGAGAGAGGAGGGGEPAAKSPARV